MTEKSLAESGALEVADVVLKLADLRAGYGSVPVLNGVNLEVHEGEAVGVVGHNGMGKTTLLKVVMGLVASTGGRIELDGTDATGSAAHNRAQMGIGYVPQGRGILPGLTSLENLRMAWREDIGETESQSIERVVDQFPRLGALLGRKGGSLSGGEQQILALARALVPKPWLLLLDEPSEGIQPSIVQEIGSTLSSLCDVNGMALVIVEQNLDLVLDVSNRVVVFERGTVIKELQASELRDGGLSELLGMGSARITNRTNGAGPAPIAVAQMTRRGEDDQLKSAPAGSGYPSSQRPISRELGKKNASIYKRSHLNAIELPATGPGEIMSTVKRPTADQMHAIVESLHMNMSSHEVAEYLEIMEGTFQSYDRLTQLPDNLPPVRYPRTPGIKPGAADNSLNAWAVKSEVHGAAHGPLSGKRVVLKDNICLAGVPLMNGASSLEGYVPDLDATLVTRILDAGGTIAGKAHCEYFCLSGGSHTCAAGPVHNPYRYGYSAGGSSSGSAALVGAGEIGMAIGGDQGGSIRMPASWCGIYGLKPTHGLVPYTGVMPIEATIDHAGPMTATVADNALLLEAIAGVDGLDPRQSNVRVDRYTAALGRGVSGLRIGVLTEGFNRPESEPDVDKKVHQAADRLRSLGAIVEDVSVPMHMDGPAIWTAIALEGLQAQMMNGNGMGFNWKGLYTTSLLDAHSAWRARADELSPSLKVSMMAAEYFTKSYRGHFYAKAQNLSRLLASAYDTALSRYDLLLSPTLPMKATPIPPSNASLKLSVQRALEMLGNTCPLNVTGHPAMSVPCGISNGLPIGMQLIGKHWDESTIYRAAHAFEQSGDWRNF
ncbi:MAG: amidase [Porticoccaceae bacterium]|nr:amidase [Porticoccaceae bacterium]